MPDIIFGTEPPPRVRKRPESDISAIFKQLRDQPEEWAIIRTDEKKSSLSSYASNIKGGVHKGNVRGEFEAEVGVLPDEMQTKYTDEGEQVTLYGVWARWVGRRADEAPAELNPGDPAAV